MNLWIVGKWEGEGWEFQGVFDDRDKAIAACRTRWYFVAPATLNETLPAEREVWPAVFYPIAEAA
jgi:hypothetical protein